VGPAGNLAAAARSHQLHFPVVFLAGPNEPRSAVAGAEVANRSKPQQMIAPLAKFLDWSAIQAVTLMMPAEPDDWRLEEALEFLKGPDFVRAGSQPAQVEFNSRWKFLHVQTSGPDSLPSGRTETPYPADAASTKVLHARPRFSPKPHRCARPLWVRASELRVYWRITPSSV